MKKTNFKTRLRIVVAFAVSLSAGRLLAAEDSSPFEFAVLPGESHALGHSLSASRDTGALAYQVLPRVAMSMGGDFAFFGFRFSGVDLRAGLFGLIEVETVQARPASFLSVPSGPYLWRGLLGYSLALSLEDIARRWLGEGGGLEAALCFRHESEHYTGSRYQTEPMFEAVPNIGNFFMPDLAARKAFSMLDLDIRVQNKFFLPDEAYSLGPGADLIFRLRAFSWAHPFLSIFGEYLFGDEDDWLGERRKTPDNYIARALLGLVFPGRTADLQVYAAAAVGHDKGLLAFERDVRFGWGIRISLFKEDSISSH